MHICFYANIYTYYYTIILREKRCTSCITLRLTEPEALICSAMQLMTLVEELSTGSGRLLGDFALEAPFKER